MFDLDALTIPAEMVDRHPVRNGTFLD